MYREEFREQDNSSKAISRETTLSLVVINSFSIATSLFLSATVFKTAPILSFKKIVNDAGLIVGSYYVGLYGLCWWMR